MNNLCPGCHCPLGRWIDYARVNGQRVCPICAPLHPTKWHFPAQPIAEPTDAPLYHQRKLPL
jgi:uncharacterized Zn finger protein (UPF0148 family)